MAIESISPALESKVDALKERIVEYGAMAIAYSGGVDSSYLAYIAHAVLGDDAHLVLADSPSIPRAEVRDAINLATERGWKLSTVATEEFENEAFLANTGNRCFFCKDELFTKMDKYAQEHGVSILAYGEIAEDRLDPTRLGAQAARQHKVVAPLADAALAKAEIRQLSRRAGLPTWDKPSFACLSSRFPVGTPVEINEMQKVETAEEVLKSFGFRQYRARHHGDLCRIEIDPKDFPKLLAVREELLGGLKNAGYRHITLDLAGYRMGSTA